MSSRNATIRMLGLAGALFLLCLGAVAHGQDCNNNGIPHPAIHLAIFGTGSSATWADGHVPLVDLAAVLAGYGTVCN